MPPKSSRIWNTFKEKEGDSSTAICQIADCRKKEVSRGKKGTPKSLLTIESLKNHLKIHHNLEYRKYLEETENDKTEKRKLEEVDDDCEMENEGVQHLFNLRTHKQRDSYRSQLKISTWAVRMGGSTGARNPFQSYKIDDPRAKERHIGVLSMMVLDLQPFSFVSDPGFNHFCYRMDPNYKIGSETFYRNCLDKAYEKGFKTVEEKLANDSPDVVSCQLDGWSSYRHGYMGCLINYITAAWKRVTLCVGCAPLDVSHSGRNIGEWLDKKLEDWGVLDKTIVCVSDTASPMLKSMEYLPTHMIHNGCMNHILQLSINDEILEKPAVKTIIMKLRGFSNYASRSNLFSEYLRQLQREAGLEGNQLLMTKQDCVTRWNSTYDMTDRAVELEEFIKKALDNEDWKKKIKYKNNGTDTPVKFSGHEWKLMKTVRNVLKPFKESTLILSKADACISQSIPILSSLLFTLRSSGSDEGVKDLKARLKTNLSDRLGSMESSEIHALATLLDPRYKNCVFRDDNCAKDAEAKLLSKLRSEYALADFLDTESIDASQTEVVVESNNNVSAGGLFAAMEAIKKKSNNEVVNEKESAEGVIKDYLNSECVAMDSKPLVWWAKYQERADGSLIKLSLCKLAKTYLTPPPTSTNCERLFSIAGQVMDEKRANLLPERLDKILFLRENIKTTNFNLDW